MAYLLLFYDGLCYNVNNNEERTNKMNQPEYSKLYQLIKHDIEKGKYSPGIFFRQSQNWKESTTSAGRLSEKR